MYIEAYDLIREILGDAELEAHVLRTTGKGLTVIDGGPQVTTPAAVITFLGGDISRGENTRQDVSYRVTFAMPYWGADGMRRCHELLDVAIEAFFEHEIRSGNACRSYIKRVDPTLVEEDAEGKWWNVGLSAVVSTSRS